MAMSIVPVRDPSADARLHMIVSVTRSFGPIIDFAKSGKPSVEMTRLVTISRLLALGGHRLGVRQRVRRLDLRRLEGGGRRAS